MDYVYKFSRVSNGNKVEVDDAFSYIPTRNNLKTKKNANGMELRCIEMTLGGNVVAVELHNP